MRIRWVALAAIILAVGCGGGSSSGGGGGGTKLSVFAQDDISGSASSIDAGEAIIVDGMGRILAAGSTSVPFANSDLVIWRLLDTGIPDTTFAGSGRIILDDIAGGMGDDEGLGILVEPGGRILVCGSSEIAAGDEAIVVLAFNGNGSPDNTFGVAGVVVFDSDPGTGEDDVAHELARDASGRIVVVGEVASASFDQDMAVLRLLSDGTLDATFATAGVFTHDDAAGGGFDDIGLDVAVDGTGRILVAGTSEDMGFDEDMVLWRLTSAGALDTAFGGQGFVVQSDVAGGMGDDTGTGVTLIPGGGGIVVVGWSMNPQDVQKMMIWKFTGAGNLDTTFGGQGYVIHKPSSKRNGILYDVEIDSMGRIIASGGQIGTGGGFDVDAIAVRYETDGTLETEAKRTAGGPAQIGLAIAPDAIGGAYIAGSTGDLFGNMNAIIYRLPE